MSVNLPLKLEKLPLNLSKEQSISLDLVEVIPIFKASRQVQERIESLLQKQKNLSLNSADIQELDESEELDDYLSLINRMLRNLYQ
jgi:hypothetical protein